MIDLDALYDDYLARFDRELGPAEVGSFAKHQGRLIQKLHRGDFDEVFTEYRDLAERYHDSLERGDTINDALIKMLRDLAAKLVIKPPA